MRVRCIAILIAVSLCVVTYGDVKGVNENDPSINQYDMKTEALSTISVKQTPDITAALDQAIKNKKTITLVGQGYDQALALSEDNILLDMTDYRALIRLDLRKKLVVVESGTTWGDIQRMINPYYLALEVMPISYYDTVGGSISTNADGRDPHYGPMIDTIQGFRFLAPNGKVLNVNRETYPELFSLVVGGHGLFGVILDVDIRLTDNVTVMKEGRSIYYTHYLDYVTQHVMHQPDIVMHYARLDTVPGPHFLREMYLVNYKKLSPIQYPSLLHEPLATEDSIAHYLIDKSRSSQLAKDERWQIERIINTNPWLKIATTRNQIMHNNFSHLFQDGQQHHQDIVQEYFIPKANFTQFIDGLREIATQYHVNLLNVSVRYLPKNNQAYLSYARHNGFAVNLRIQAALDKQASVAEIKSTQSLIALALKLQGTYSLSDQTFASKKQLWQSYPNINAFFARKRAYDPQQIFVNEFYRHYG